jgi:hypothetical protein
VEAQKHHIVAVQCQKGPRLLRAILKWYVRTYCGVLMLAAMSQSRLKNTSKILQGLVINLHHPTSIIPIFLKNPNFSKYAFQNCKYTKNGIM